MTKQVGTLEINKCILSKLWYTSLVVYQESDKNNSLPCQSDTVNFVQSETLITNLIHSQNENQHQWITQTLLQKFIDNLASDFKDIKKQRSYVQMIHALRLCRSLTGGLQQGLLKMCENDSEQMNSEMFEKIRDEFFIFLKQNVYSNPTVVCWIINELFPVSFNASAALIDALQDIYISLAKESIESQLSKRRSISDSSPGCTLCIMSKMYISESNILELSRWSFPVLLKACNTRDIDLVLYSRMDRKLFDAWCAFLDEFYSRSKVADNLNVGIRIQETLLDRASTSAPLINKNNLIGRVTNMKMHWVVDILDISYVLVLNEKYDDVSLLLSCKLLKTFWPVLLFKILNDCPKEDILASKIEETDNFICNSIKFLISKCNFQCDSTLQGLNVLLKKHVKVVEYILHWMKESFEARGPSQLQGTIKSIDPFHQKISVKHIFNLLQHFNCLSVLKMITNLHEQEYKKITDLLKDLGESENIFYAYCSVLSAVKAILLSDAYNAKQPIIASHFSDMKDYAQALYPLSLRVQVIENIFSLLFLRHEDFDHAQKSYNKSNTSPSDEESRLENKLVEQRLTGFMCNKFVVRDVLFHLKEIMLSTEIEWTKVRNETTRGEEIDQIQTHISSINAAIMDAKWRLELYTNLQFTEDANTPKEANKSVPSKANVPIDGKLTSSRFKENILFYQEGSTSDETKIMSDSSSESELINNNTKWRKRAKNLALVADSTTTKDITHKPLFVNFMLASKETLIIQCLWRNDYAKAQGIIEASDMRSTQLNGEMEFSKALHVFKENIYRQANTLKDKSETTENLQSSTLENIRLVAQEGVQSSRQTSQLETFLASQEANLRALSMNNLSSNEILTICVLDLALTASQNRPVSKNLCEVAMKHLKLCKTFDNTEYANFFAKIYQLLHEMKDEFSVEDILCDAKVSLSVKAFREKGDLWTDIAATHHEFKESQANKNTINKILKDGSYLPGLKVLGNMAAISSGTEKYMQNLYSHLQLLHTIIPAEQPILTVSDLLRISLQYYFGHQIFELDIEPSKLEAIAHDLQVNLVYSILANACPSLFYEKTIKYPAYNRDTGCIILNKASCKSDLSHKIQGPNQCVSEILTELLQSLENLNFGQLRLSQEFCEATSKHPGIQDTLSKTSRLASLDLSELSMGDETLAFLLNTWNLMFLHASLAVWAHHPPSNNLQHTVSSMSIGYLIGDLGLVTLAALKSKLLNNIVPSDELFIQLEELNEPVWQDLDITHDSRVIFMMASELYGTPCISVYNAESWSEDLRYAYHEYFEFYSSKWEKSAQTAEQRCIILLPYIAKQYQDSFSECYNSDLYDVAKSVNLQSVEDYFNLCNSGIVIEYMAPTYSYDIILDYSSYSDGNHKQVGQRKGVSKTHAIRSSLLQYLEGHCWVVSYLLQRIQNENPTILENNCDNLNRTACLENLLCSSWVKGMRLLFENNQTLAAIFETIPGQKLWAYFEAALKENQWDACARLINALPDDLVRSTELQCFKDKVLSCIVSKSDAVQDSETLQYVYQMKDIYALSQTVLYNIDKWHVNICENALLHAVHHKDSYKLHAHCKHQLTEILHRILIFHKMLPYCVTKANGTWYDVAYCTEKIEPFKIVKSLINAEQFEICLEWLESQAFSLEIHFSVMQDFLMGLLKSESQNFKQMLKFLQALPLSQSVKLCKTVLKKLESIDSLQFICNYLLDHSKTTETIKYRRTLVGIDVLRMLEIKERPLYIHLIKEPLLMLEQSLMNCKFGIIQEILSRIEDKLEKLDISRSSIDSIIRFYAEKSLDCRVSLQCDNIESRSRNVQHSALESENTEFIMPVLVPTKDEWVPNDKASECSCCKTVIFSMFNRRHHCRRCGRIICATCSQHRMQVPGYPPSVLVRVCDDCKRQTVLQMRALQGAPSTPSSEMFDYWRLTRDQKHNETIREEFSFEYAPNISLCLAILNLHSDHKTYTSFLLDRCDEMKRLLEPVSGGKVNPEVDHTVIIKMIRSLLVAAKVKCAKLGLNTGLMHCDRFLSQVDLIATLVQSDCLQFIPSDNLHGRTFRKLRDLLIEKEQWTLALDVSTKAGLDTQGVWATWGKACLKMGYFDQAREKFFHCLDKINNEDFDDWVILSYPKESTTRSSGETRRPATEMNTIDEDKAIKADDSSTRRAEFARNRPLKDPPLLTEILQILINLSTYKSVHSSHCYQYKSSASQETLNSFGSLKVTGQGQFNAKHPSTVVQNVYYHESLYYLLTYGSYNSILEFFLKHEKYNECLAFTLENDVESDLFFNAVYMYCLKDGSTEKLHEAMRSEDSSLLVWKKYLIHVCHSLERKQYLNILYQLQLFMKDSVRAAMTCIRFYINDVSDYTDLCARGSFLLDAQRHLESELQIETLNRKRKKSTSSVHSNQGILTMEMEPSEIDKHINTICRQMEIAKFLANCEKEGRSPIQFLNLLPGKDCDSFHTLELPTLFGNQQQKIDLAVLAILCGRNIEEGFGIAFRIMQDYNLPQQKVYSVTGHILTLKTNIPAIEQLIKCCHTSGIPNSHIISDYVLTHCVKLLLNRLNSEPESVLKNDIHSLIRLITDVELKINAYIECKQLKAAYLLAVKHSRGQDIRKILKESDRLGQNAIKAICIKWLQQEPKL